MINKIIAAYLKTNKRLVIPQFGAFIHKDGEGEVVFVAFLKKDDGVLVGLLNKEYGVGTDEAQAIISEYVSEIDENTDRKGGFLVEGLGTLKKDANGIFYLDRDPAGMSAAAAFGDRSSSEKEGGPEAAPGISDAAETKTGSGGPEVAASKPDVREPAVSAAVPQPAGDTDALRQSAPAGATSDAGAFSAPASKEEPFRQQGAAPVAADRPQMQSGRVASVPPSENHRQIQTGKVVPLPPSEGRSQPQAGKTAGQPSGVHEPRTINSIYQRDEYGRPVAPAAAGSSVGQRNAQPQQPVAAGRPPVSSVPGGGARQPVGARPQAGYGAPAGAPAPQSRPAVAQGTQSRPLQPQSGMQPHTARPASGSPVSRPAGAFPAPGAAGAGHTHVAAGGNVPPRPPHGTARPGTRQPVRPGGRPAPSGQAKADLFIVIAVIAALVALGAIAFGLLSPADEPELIPIEVPVQQEALPDSIPADGR